MLRRARPCVVPVEQGLRQFFHARHHVSRPMSTVPTPSSSATASQVAQEQHQIESQVSKEAKFAATVEHGRGLRPAYQHRPTHNIPVALIHFRSHYPHLLDLATHFATHAAAAVAIPCSRPAYLPTQRSLWTVLRGPFAHKKSQENFERKVHKRVIKAWDADSQAVDRWLTYLHLHPVEGVGMRVVRWYRTPVGIGREQQPPEEVLLESVTDKQKVEEMAAKIVKEEMKAAGLSNETSAVKSS